MADKDVYQELGEMVDREDIVGIKVTPAFIRLLKLQFTKSEAELALKIGLTGAPLSELAEKLDMDRDKLFKKLWKMADKGTMWIDPGKKDDPVCRVLGVAAPGLIETGIWGGIRFSYDVELGKAIHEVTREWAKEKLCTLGFPFAPVWAHPWAMPDDAPPEENIAAFLKDRSYFSVSFCPCRLSHWLSDPGDHCEHMLETCLHTGDTARWVVEHKQGREITYEDAIELLKKSNADGLVHTININGFICNCCSDCCPMFIGLHEFKTKTFVPSNYMPTVDEDECNACGKCEKACPVNAIEVEDAAEVALDTCIGCGVCVTTCPTKSISFIRRPEQVEKYIA